MEFDYTVNEVHVIFGTGNEEKIQQMMGVINRHKLDIFGTEFVTTSKCKVDTIEECDTNEGNAVEKVKAVYNALNENGTFVRDDVLYVIISEDTAFHIPALNNAPGIYAKRLEKVPELNVRPRYKDECIYDWMNKMILSNTKDIKEPTAMYSCGFAVTSVYRGNIITITDTHEEEYEIMNHVIKGGHGFSYDEICSKNGVPLSMMTLDEYHMVIPRITGLYKVLSTCHTKLLESL